MLVIQSKLQNDDTEGADEITMLDITASHETRDTTYKTVESIASQVLSLSPLEGE